MSTLKNLEFLYLDRLSSLYSENEIRAIFLWAAESVLGMPALNIRMNKQQEVSAPVKRELGAILDKMRDGMPLQYVLGYGYFRGKKFKLNQHVLIPRPETEELIDLILQTAGAPTRVLDIGSGSGCIPITLKHSLPQAQVYGWDISTPALALARENAAMHQVEVCFEQVDILYPSKEFKGPFDCIVSNPPYIPESEKNDIAPHVLDYEPEIALFVKDVQPLVFYDAIAKFARHTLSESGRLYFECNRRFARQVKDLLERLGFLAVQVHRDMQGHDRFVSAINPSIL